MAKFYGKIGYESFEETSPGVHKPVETVRNYYGDVTRQSRRLEGSQKVNDDIDISNTISIVADPYAYSHFHEMKWIEWYGSKWKIATVDVEYPRLNLTIGGLYNAE